MPLISRLIAAFALLLPATLQAGIDLRLPTENHHLFTGQPERFYMYVDRIFEGEVSKPWEGGSYGYVRTARRIDGEVYLTKFHEGIDIQPVNRDKAGNPLDLVCSIADGRVVHTSPVSGRSNYGKYVVVEHRWDDSSVVSLYAHFAEVTCKPGDVVSAGSVLGRMGYTGAGINRTRAHVHLELGMVMSLRYEGWHQQNFGSRNYHGIYNGMNITGADVARFFLAHKQNPELGFSEFVASTPAYFRVTVPAKPGETPEFVERHPWICRGNPEGATSWDISFTETGFPIAFTPGKKTVAKPAVTAVRPSKIPHRYLTRNLISGEGRQATLARNGEKLVSLLMNDFPVKTATAKN